MQRKCRLTATLLITYSYTPISPQTPANKGLFRNLNNYSMLHMPLRKTS